MSDSDRAALVTGSSRGIGQATAQRLAEDGFDVVVHYHENEAGARETANLVEAAGQASIVHQADIADPDQARKLAKAAIDAFGHLDTVVNNAGTYPRQTVDEVSVEDFERVVEVNAHGPFHVTRPLVDRLIEQQGAIVNLASIMAVQGSSHGTHYSTGKAGVLGFTKALARELADDGVRVNAICPGAIETDMIADDTEDKRAQREEKIPTSRVGQPEEIASVVAFLVGDDASYVTGETVHVNGGLRMD
jgi:3-oxoacyl-[acyl-carrier protein] reductase